MKTIKGPQKALVLLCLSTSSVALTGGYANAQTYEQTSQDGLDIVVVQARKRAESIQDVPASVTAISEERSELLNLSDVDDYIRQVPGAILVASGPSYLDDIAIRGQGGGRLGFSESTTGIYRDGIYVAGGGFGGRTFSRIDFFDAANVEVYRGPQGALYGRNAVGGAVNIITRRPGDDFGGYAKVGYNNVGQYNIESAVNLPTATEGFGVRIGGYYTAQGDDGFYRAEGFEDALDSNNEEWGFRGSALWEAGPETTFFLLGERSFVRDLAFGARGQNLTLDPGPFDSVGLDVSDSSEINQTSLLGRVEHGLGWADLTVVGNYKSRDGDRDLADLDHFLGFNSPALELFDVQAEEFERYGFEARLSSNGDGPFTWLIGGDYQNYTSEVFAERTSGALLGPFAFSAALRRQLRTDTSTEELSSFSFFGQLAYALTDRLEISAEARVQKDSKDFVFERVDGDPLTDETIPFTSFEADWTRFLPTVTVNYDVRDDLTVYARAATGYRPGGFNPTPTVGFFDQTEYGPELAKSFEGGLKGDFKIGNVRIKPQFAGYYVLVDDSQQTTNLSSTNTAFSLQNVGDVALYGAEFEVIATTQFAGGNLYSNLGLSTTDGKFDDGTTVIFQGVTYDLSDGRLPRTRDYIVNYNLVYDRPIIDDISGFFSFSFQAEGGGYDNAIGSQKIPGLSRSSEHYEIVDLAAGLHADNWRLQGYVKNLTDNIYQLVVVNNNRYVNDPRSYGVNLRVSF